MQAQATKYLAENAELQNQLDQTNEQWILAMHENYELKDQLSKRSQWRKEIECVDQGQARPLEARTST